MTEWLTYILTTIGLVYFFTQSLIFVALRVRITRGSIFREVLFYCPSCMGFWVGVVLSLVWLVPGRAGLGPSPWQDTPKNLLTMLLGGLMSMAISHIWSALTQQGVNPAWAAEQSLREENDAPQEEEEDHG